MSRRYSLECKLCKSAFIGGSPRTFYCPDCYETKLCSTDGCENKSKNKMIKSDSFKFNSCIRRGIAIRTSAQRMRTMKENGTFEKFQKAGTEAALKAWNSKTEGEKLEQHKSQREALSKWWKEATYEEKQARTKPMIDGMKRYWNNASEEIKKHFSINKAQGRCSVCDEFNKSRDMNARGIDCKCYKLNPIGVKIFDEIDTLCETHKGESEGIFQDGEYVCWEFFKEKAISNHKINVPKSCICKRCYSITRQEMFCSSECENIYIKESGYYFKTNNKCKTHSNSNLAYKGRCWECFKEDFTSNTLNLGKFEFEEIPTFRFQESDSWEGSATAFERSLTDLNIGWFVYIKFFKLNGKEIPAVAGKSGSLLVNFNGSDVNFSEVYEDGPARRMIIESNGSLEWDKTKIALLRCCTEEEAFRVEKEIQEKFKLMGS